MPAGMMMWHNLADDVCVKGLPSKPLCTCVACRAAIDNLADCPVANRQAHILKMNRLERMAMVDWLRQAIWHFEFTGTFRDNDDIVDGAKSKDFWRRRRSYRRRLRKENVLSHTVAQGVTPAGADLLWKSAVKTVTGKGRTNRRRFRYVRMLEQGRINGRTHYHALLHCPADMAGRLVKVWDNLCGFPRMRVISADAACQRGAVERYVFKHALKGAHDDVGDSTILMSSNLPDALLRKRNPVNGFSPAS